MKMKVHSKKDDKIAGENRRTKVRDGRVKKFNKKFDTSSKNSKIPADGNFKKKPNVNEVHDRKPIRKLAGSKVKHLKKKFGKSLLMSTNAAWKPGASRGTEKEDNIHLQNVKSKSRRRKERRGIEDAEKEVEEKIPPPPRRSDDPVPIKDRWVNRQRVLVFACRGISTRDRHLMRDLRRLMPHSRPESKMERRENLSVVNEMCTMKHCNKCILFEGRANRDVYMWISDVANGPSVKFLLQNIYTMQELKFTGNCLIGSRPLLSFDEEFDTSPHYRVIRELLVQVFGTPNRHPKSQPFYDHVFSFTILDNRIWFRNYQILSEEGALVEIGPRFLMNPVKIFQGSFGGVTIWENPFYVTPTRQRIIDRKTVAGKYLNNKEQKENMRAKQGKTSFKLPETDDVFTGNTWETASKLVSKKTEVGGALKKRKKKKNQGKGKVLQKSSDSWAVQNMDEEQ